VQQMPQFILLHHLFYFIAHETTALATYSFFADVSPR